MSFIYDDDGADGYLYPFDDDLYWINQREADDYRNEVDDYELYEDDLGDD